MTLSSKSLLSLWSQQSTQFPLLFPLTPLALHSFVWSLNHILKFIQPFNNIERILTIVCYENKKLLSPSSFPDSALPKELLTTWLNSLLAELEFIEIVMNSIKCFLMVVLCNYTIFFILIIFGRGRKTLTKVDFIHDLAKTAVVFGFEMLFNIFILFHFVYSFCSYRVSFC